MGGHLSWLTRLPGLAEWGRVTAYRMAALKRLPERRAHQRRRADRGRDRAQRGRCHRARDRLELGDRRAQCLHASADPGRRREQRARAHARAGDARGQAPAGGAHRRLRRRRLPHGRCAGRVAGARRAARSNWSRATTTIAPFCAETLEDVLVRERLHALRRRDAHGHGAAGHRARHARPAKTRTASRWSSPPPASCSSRSASRTTRSSTSSTAAARPSSASATASHRACSPRPSSTATAWRARSTATTPRSRCPGCASASVTATCCRRRRSRRRWRSSLPGAEPARRTCEFVDDRAAAAERIDALLRAGGADVGRRRGRGAGDAIERCRRLAERYGARLAVSRPQVEAGRATRAELVGASGDTVAARTYLALGISGALPHLVGMADSARPSWPSTTTARRAIFEHADLGVTADAGEMVDALLALPASLTATTVDVRAMRTISVVGVHAGGEIGNVVVGGVLPPPGATVFEQMQALERDGDALRRLLLREPRGSVAAHANLIVPATRDDCDAGFIIMEPTEYPPMSGSNTICTTTVLLETGMLPMHEPETVVRLEAPGRRRRGARDLPRRPLRVGRVHERALLRRRGSTHRSRSRGSARSASTSPTAACSTRSPTPRRWASRSSPARRASSRWSASASARRRASSCPAPIPRIPPSTTSRSCRSQRPGAASARSRATPSSSRPGRLDRSPTGTGLCARMAVLHARGLMAPGDAMSHASVIGSVFDGRIVVRGARGRPRRASSPPCAARPGSPASTSISSIRPTRSPRATSWPTPGA